MRKNRIRLTESQLHKVIKESVKQVLSELDWKTYANAAKKAREQERYGQMNSFDKATERALDNQYGGTHFVNSKDDTFQTFKTSDDDLRGYDMAYKPWNKQVGAAAGVTDDFKPFGSEDIANFAYDKSKYVKGKGWQ